ncbi:MAG: endonuclease/exonuclease/phosphatase family protein [Planctomycetes bacterium]|nr:endonuclease/exonuclease/phosphatase family protein [Planctomycetota bacterium]
MSAALQLAAAAGLAAAVLGAARRRPTRTLAGHGARGARPGDRPGDLQSGAGAARLRVGTFNIHGGKGTDGVRNLARTAAVLQGLDLIGLQEVRRRLVPPAAPQVAALAARLGLGWLLLPTERRFGAAHRGNGLLTRWPIADWRVEPLLPRSTGGYRSLARLQLGDRRPGIDVFVTHVTRRPERDVQLATVLERFVTTPRAILLADLNARPDHPALRALLDRGDATDAIATTLGPADHTERVDWILTRGLRVLAGGRIDGPASDHPAYWAELAVE